MSMLKNQNEIVTIERPEVEIISAYGNKKRVSIRFPEDSPYTKQSHRDECDVNKIMARYLATGEIPNINEAAPQYLDATGFDYQEAMEYIAGAKSLFGELPAIVRERFKNDPGLFLDFVQDEKNAPEMREMGLMSPLPPEVSPLTPAAVEPDSAVK